jgi:RimJ/RimL family protein N-acetyltransferase
VYKAFQDPAMHQWHIRSADSEDEARGWIHEWVGSWKGERNDRWAVTDGETGRLLCRVALRNMMLGDGVAEVAYWTVAAACGLGVAPRAVAALTGWVLDDIGFHRLELTHAVRNEASCRVATKTGFALEGTKRSAPPPPGRLARHAPARTHQGRPGLAGHARRPAPAP